MQVRKPRYPLLITAEAMQPLFLSTSNIADYTKVSTAISGDINGNIAVPGRPRAITATVNNSKSKATIFFSPPLQFGFVSVWMTTLVYSEASL